MAWNEVTTRGAVKVDVGGVPYYLTITNTATVVVGDTLRMFGIQSNQLSASEDLDGNSYDAYWSDAQEPPPASAGPYGGFIGFLDTTELDGWEFGMVYEDHQPIQTTVIPSGKGDQAWSVRLQTYASDGTITESVETSSFDVEYKDPHVIELPDGQGWLMLLARYRSYARAEGEAPATQNSVGQIGDIVAYLAPANDPGFQGDDVKGPLLMVSSLDALSPDLAPENRLRMWLGVPAGVVLTTADSDAAAQLRKETSPSSVFGNRGPTDEQDASDEVAPRKWDFGTIAEGDGAGSQVLYLYYTAETVGLFERDLEDNTGLCWVLAAENLRDYDPHMDTSNYTYNQRRFQGALCLKRIPLADLLEFFDDSERPDEGSWDNDLEAAVAPGDLSGPIRLWADQGDGTLVNYFEVYLDASATGPLPVALGDSISMFIPVSSRDSVYGLGSYYKDDLPEAVLHMDTYGIWNFWSRHGFRQTFTAPAKALVLGLDFVVEPQPPFDRVIPWEVTFPGITPDTGAEWFTVTTRSDPDVVRRPDGTWVIFCGAISRTIQSGAGGWHVAEGPPDPTPLREVHADSRADVTDEAFDTARGFVPWTA